MNMINHELPKPSLRPRLSTNAPMGLPRELNGDVTAEILLRVAPDELARIFHASIVCKLWHRILSDPDFCRRYRSFHRASLLGFFNNLDFPPRSHAFAFDFPAPYSRFVATTDASPLPDADAAHDDGDRRVSWALDCRHGRVLFAEADSRGLAVWDPIVDDWTDLPPPGITYVSFSAVVLCDVASCDHRDCRAGRFRVVCIGLDVSRTAYACVYSSEDRAWQAPVSDGTKCWRFDAMRPAVVGDGIYCTVSDGYCILKYDLVERGFSWINMPSSFRRDPVLMQNEDGSLGLAGVRRSRLYLWSRNPEGDDAAGWVQRKVIKLRKLFAVGSKQCIKANLIGFAEDVGVLFIRTHDGVFTVEMKSRRVTMVSKPSKIYRSVVPFLSFITPDRAS